MNFKSLVEKLIMLFVFLPIFLFGQDRNFWSKTDINGIKQTDIVEYSTQINNPVYFKLDMELLADYLSTAPDRLISKNSTVILNLPNPNGKMESFVIFSTQTMSKELSRKYENVRSYVGRNMNDQSHSLRITLTPFGFYAMTSGSSFGTTLINPYARNSNTHIVFSSKNVYSNLSADFECGVEDNLQVNETVPPEVIPKFINTGILRKYKLAVAATAQYSQFQWEQAGLNLIDSEADRKVAVQAAITITIDRINEFYERDLGVTLELVANNDEIVFLIEPDPYTNTNNLTMLAENQTSVDNIIGSSNYDIGHVLSIGNSGVASTPSVCNPNFKARGLSRMAAAAGNLYDIRILGHEMGHQFGANHTQSNNCNRRDDTAVEPGSGSTFMSYAGICAPNVQGTNDNMFHYISISEISDRFAASTGTCAENITITGASPPIVQSVPNYTIPKNTPFVLEAIATDANADDLTYSWEQLNNEVATMPPVSTSTVGPSFRVFPPSDSPIRYFPSINTLLNGAYSNTWEVLPTVSRTLDFGVIVRDNNLSGGQVTSTTTTLTVDDSAGPFRVTSQNATSINWVGSTDEIITWDVANTDNASGVNAQYVDILLSIDSGQTYNLPLAYNTPNDGIHQVSVPNINASNARIMVRGSNHIFFDINTETFSIIEGDECLIATIPTNLQANSITTHSANVGWNAIPGAKYDLRFRENGISVWTLIEDLMVSNTSITGLSSLTEYEVQVRSKCSGNTLSDYSSSLFFTTNDDVIIYCDAGAANLGFSNINRLVLNTINHTSPTDNTGYADFTDIYTTLSRGETYLIEVTEKDDVFYQGDQLIVWIDFNQNGVFETNEKVIETEALNSSNFLTIYPFGGSIEIPIEAKLGETRMRIRLNNINFSSNASPCGDSTIGEVEDYTVVIYDDYIFYDHTWTPQNPSGISVATENILIADSSPILSGITTCNNLDVLPFKTLNIEGILNLNGNIKNDGSLIFTSNSTSTGQLDTFSGSISGIGEVEVQRYIPARRAFRFMSSAVNSTESIRTNWQEGVNNTGIVHNDDNLNPNPGFGTHISGSLSGFHGFDATASGAPSLFIFNKIAQSWSPVANTDANTLEAGSAYRLMVRGDRSINLESNASSPTSTTLRAKGQLHTGAFDIPSSELSNTIYDFNFFGNPYQAAVDMTAVLANSTNLHPFIYVYDPTLGGTENRGAFVTVNVSGDLDNGTSNNPDSSANQYLQPGQSVFVQTLSNAPAAIQFLESHKAVNQPQTAIFNITSNLSLQLYDAASFNGGNTSKDGIRIRFSDMYSSEVDGLDASKMANQDENLATINGSTLLSIESRNVPEAGEEIPLFINAYRTTDYILAAQVNQLEGITAYLVDEFLGTTQTLSAAATTLYPFSIDASNPASTDMFRFSLIFENENLGTDNFDEVGFSLFPNPSQNGKFSIQTKGLNGKNAVVIIYNTLGQKVFTQQFNEVNNNKLLVDASGLSSGIYMVKLNQNNQSFIKKLIVD